MNKLNKICSYINILTGTIYLINTNYPDHIKIALVYYLIAYVFYAIYKNNNAQ
jgi:hypothetical protein